MAQDIPPRERGSGRIHVVIDTPAGSRTKYKYDAQLDCMRVSRMLRAIEHFFRSYNGFQGRKFEITSRGGARDALRTFERARQAFATDNAGAAASR